MGKLQCCGALRICETYILAPENGFLAAELSIIKCCPACGHYVVQLTRIDFEHNVSFVRKSNSKAHSFFEKISPCILFKQELNPNIVYRNGKSYLNYNEYGRKKRCYSNLCSLSIGRKDPYEALDLIKNSARKKIAI